MKTTILSACIALCSLAGFDLRAQWYGQENLQYSNSILSSAKRTFNYPGYVMAGFTPARTPLSTDPDFIINKLEVGGNYNFPTDFSAKFQIRADIDCGNSYVDMNNCSGVSVIETTNQGGGEAYAIVGGFSWGIFFATMDANGFIINKTGWIFPYEDVNSRKPVIRESSVSGEYFICGDWNLNAYVMRVNATGTQIWGNSYGPSLEPRDLIESSNGAELIVVGRGGLGGVVEGFFMSLDPNNGAFNYCNLYDYNSSDDWFSCIEIANSPTGGRGYILGGRSYAQSAGNLNYSQWMSKIDQGGNIIWSSLIRPGSYDPAFLEGEEINRVIERHNPNNTWEYYGVAEANHVLLGGALIARKNLVVYKLDDNGGNSLGPNNEFHYIGGGYAPHAPASGSPYTFSDLTLIETGGGPDDGFQAFGSLDISSGYHYFVKSYFNGVSSCKESLMKIDHIFQGPGLIGTQNPYINNISPCGQSIDLVALSIYQPFIPTNCKVTFDPTGSNARQLSQIESEQKQALQSTVFPNPSSCDITVAVSGVAIIRVLNTLGQKVAEYKNEEDKEAGIPVNFEALGVKPGVYLIQVSSAAGISHHKVLYELK